MLVLRGLPGSGKTHTARKLREIEAQHGADALRIHGIDDYFVTVQPRPSAMHTAFRVLCKAHETA